MCKLYNKRTVHQKFSSLIKKSVLLSLFLFICFNLFSLTIMNVGPNQTYSNLQSAINALPNISNDTSVEIRVFPNINNAPYTNSTSYDINFENYAVTNITIKRSGSTNAIFKRLSGQPDRMFKVYGKTVDESPTSQIKFEGIDFINEGSNIGISAIHFYNNFDKITFIKNSAQNFSCVIDNRTTSLIHNEIKNIEIKDNSFNNISSFTYFYVRKNFTNIENNIFNNSGGYVSGAFNEYNNELIFKNNNQINQTTRQVISVVHPGSNGKWNATIENNRFINGQLILEQVSGNVLNNYFRNDLSNLSNQLTFHYMRENVVINNQISNNIFINDINPVLLTLQSNQKFQLINNSFISAQKACTVNYYYCSNPEIVVSFSKFENNYFDVSSGFISVNSLGSPITLTTPIFVKNCFFKTTSQTLPVYPNVAIDQTSCLCGTPLITMDNANYTYSMQWNTTGKSPLLMNGSIPTFYKNEDTSWDRLDIGAVQFNAMDHEARKYVIYPANFRSGLKWTCFPVVENLYNPTSNDPDYAKNFFQPILDEERIDYIDSKSGNQNINHMVYISQQNDWSNSNYQVTPVRGHKIKTKDTYMDYQYLYKGSLKPNPATQIYLYAFQQGSTTQYNENWIGYFIETTQTPQQAFGSRLSEGRIYYIQTQNWTMVLNNGVWRTTMQYGLEPTLKYGDMVIIKTYVNIPDFSWINLGNNQPEYVRAQTEYYQYEEKSDYIPVYASMNIENKPDEIAVYIDDVCKGAAVVTDTLVEIPAYIIEDIDNNPELEIRMYYKSKSMVETPSSSFFNDKTNSYTSKLKVSERKDFFLVNVGKDAVPQIPESKLSLQNYPNPFNPSTKLSYQIAENGKVDLEIYNIKGQKVKTIFSGNQEKGLYQIEWNGKDSNNHSVSSGIYYARLRTSGKVLVNKMLLMK